MRFSLWVSLFLLLVACADSEPPERVEEPQTLVAVIPPKPRVPEPSLIGRFVCDGSILHPSIDSKLESAVQFSFDVAENYLVAGQLARVGPPLSLPGGKFNGRLAPIFNNDGNLTGGQLVVSWPHVREDAPAEFHVMRETFVRAGHTVNGVGQVIRRTSRHTYLSAKIWLDPRSSPAAVGFRRAAFVNATCFPEVDLPPKHSSSQ